MKKILFVCSMLLSSYAGYAQKLDTMEIHFGLNDTKLNKEATDQIDQLIFKDRLILGQKLIVLGYTDFLGSTEYNVALSNARAKSVRDYLVSSGFDQNDITLFTGKGKIDRTGESGKDGYATDRKVQIIIDRKHPMSPPVAAKPKVVEKDISHLEANETMALKDILFQGGTDQLLPGSFPELEKLAAFLNGHKTVKIQIEGHICCMIDPDMTDDLGPDGKSQPLSGKRAQTIYKYLISKGIDKDRMRFVGLGSTKPLVTPEITEEDQQANRRVEIRILSK